jgi:hypothetical protein
VILLNPKAAKINYRTIVYRIAIKYKIRR